MFFLQINIVDKMAKEEGKDVNAFLKQQPFAKPGNLFVCLFAYFILLFACLFVCSLARLFVYLLACLLSLLGGYCFFLSVI